MLFTQQTSLPRTYKRHGIYGSGRLRFCVPGLRVKRRSLRAFVLPYLRGFERCCRARCVRAGRGPFRATPPFAIYHYPSRLLPFLYITLVVAFTFVILPLYLPVVLFPRYFGWFWLPRLRIFTFVTFTDPTFTLPHST